MMDDEAALETMVRALESDHAPIAMMPYDGPPIPPEFHLDLLRDMLTETGGATASITFGTSDGMSGMFPLINVDPRTGLNLLLMTRKANVLGSITWVAIASDVDRTMVDTETGESTEGEALMVLCMAPDGPGYSKIQPYVRTADGFEWGEIEDHTATQSSGALYSLMQQLVVA